MIRVSLHVFSVNRRNQWMIWTGVSLLACLCLVSRSVSAQAVTSSAEPPEPNTPIEHFIFLMQENHSFDNYFGTYPGADGIPPDTCIPYDPSITTLARILVPMALRGTEVFPVNHLDLTTTDCVEPFHFSEGDVQPDDPDHSRETFQLQYNDGAMNGFVYALEQRNQDGRLAMAYYNDQDLPYYWNIADEYVLFDNFFTSAGDGSFINHLYWIAGTHDEPPEGQSLQEYLAGVTTIFDVLEAEGISWKFYIQNYEPDLTYRTRHLYPGDRQSQVTWVPLLSFDRFIDDPNLNSKMVNLDEYYEDLNRNTLPNVAFMVPSGPSEHPPSSLMSGQRFVRILIQSLMQSDYWDKSAFIWTYDDWGGWYDHVPPPQVDQHGFGPRAPALLVSAYARRGLIDSTLLDFTSGLKFIQENWNLPSLAERDANANGLMSAFDFTSPPRPARIISMERESGAARPEPKREVIYMAYGAALVLASVVITTAVVTTRTSTRAGNRHGEQT
ncbi:MAG: alkaline phosphatase family protein [Anaerolineae bacterium]|nr:alkaline phosphatase family protein [Anaerolineae bacterium]